MLELTPCVHVFRVCFVTSMVIIKDFNFLLLVAKINGKKVMLHHVLSMHE